MKLDLVPWASMMPCGADTQQTRSLVEDAEQMPAIGNSLELMLTGILEHQSRPSHEVFHGL
jgi:hypothetical protein